MADYPFSVKTEKKITAFDLMAIHRDWLGVNPWLTPYDDSEA